ncbi:MAG TPA: CdaR family protein [Polyangiaceae bacterium]|nr:CdaR family protein [Polyangiaceae bacterium]
MTAPSGMRGFVASALTENLGLKLVSVMCAVGFFVFIRGSERAERRFDVGVAQNLPPESANRALVKDPPSEISVTLSGPRTQIEELPRDLGTIVLDLSSGHESTIELTQSMIPNVPPGIKVEQIFPQRIEVRWDDVVSREVPVLVGRSGEPAKGFSVKSKISPSPETVVVHGPRTLVDLIQFARTAPFDVDGLTEGYHSRVLPLDLPPQGVELAVPSINATVEVTREERVIPFKAVKVEVVGLPKATTKPDVVTVTVRGIPDAVMALDVTQIVPRVELPSDVDTTKPGSQMGKVVVQVPNVDAEVQPSEVLVKW